MTLQNTTFGEAKFYLEDFSLIVSAVNSVNDKVGLSRLTKCLSLLNYIDHPKDFVFLASYFSKFFDSYARANLFPQTVNLLMSTTEKDCMVEVTKIFCYLYNAFKFKNHVFNMRAMVEKEKVGHLLLSKEMIRDIASLASRTNDEIFEACVLIYVNVVK